MQNREAIAGQWLERVLRTHPGFLGEEPDPFRNPVVYTLRESLRVLLDELLLDMDARRVSAALDAIVQIRAVQDFAPGRALEFLFQLKDILREHPPGRDLNLLDSRIDQLVLEAFDTYVKYREKTFEARANEVRRRVYLLERAAAARRGEA